MKQRAFDAFAFRNEPRASSLIPYSYHVTNNIVSTPDGGLITVFRIEGRNHQCTSKDDLGLWYGELNQLLKSIGRPGIEIWTHLYHHDADINLVHRSDNFFEQKFLNSYRKKFIDNPVKENEFFLSIVRNPTSDRVQKVFSFLERPSRDDFRSQQLEGIVELEETAALIISTLAPYGVHQLGIYYDEKNTDLAFSTTLEFFSFLLNHEKSQVPVCRERACEYLASTRLVSALRGDFVQLRKIDAVEYSAALELLDFSETTVPGQLNYLLEAECDFILTQSFSCMSAAAARGMLSKQENALVDTRDSGLSQLAQISEAKDDIVSNRYVMGDYHCTLHVFGSTSSQALKNARDMRALFARCHLIAGAIGLATEPAWYAKLPGNRHLRPRVVPLHSGNFACLSPFHNFMKGKKKNNPWGEAMGLFRVKAGKLGSPLYFSAHSTPEQDDNSGERPPGNTLILGKVGSGKSTLLSALITMCMKFRPKLFIYDKDRGLYPLVRALGGHYFSVKSGLPTGWQPLQLEPSPLNVDFVQRLIRLCLEKSAGMSLRHGDVEHLNRAIATVMSDFIPLKSRTLSRVRDLIPAAQTFSEQDEGHPRLISVIQRWCEGGTNGWLFDNPVDELRFDQNDIFAFDLTDFIVSAGQPEPETRSPMLFYLLHRIEASLDGSRHVMQVFDEFAQYLDDPVLSEQVKRGLKTNRKKDCTYWFATQEPNDALKSRIGETIAQSLTALFCLYNPGADREDYIKGLKLTEQEFESVASLGETARDFLVKQGERSAVASMDLRGMSKEITILSGTPDNARRIEDIIQRHGENPSDWIPKFWESINA